MWFSQSKNIWSKLVLLIIAVAWIWTYFNNKLWKGDQIVWDVIQYYEYLPAVFIYDDISFKFKDKDLNFFGNRIWFTIAPNGNRVCMATIGMSLLYSPFFFIGHIAAILSNEPANGYSIPYQSVLISGCFFYLLAGLLFLRKTLMMFFSDAVTAVVLASVYFGTNLFYYSLFNGLMPHAYLFSLSCIFMYTTVLWHSKPSYFIAGATGALAGLMTLIRPTLCVMCLFFLLYGISGKKSLVEKISLFLNNKLKLILLSLCFIAVLIPQLFYWKYITGQWVFYSYPGERFYFDNPHIIEGLFSYRKGWLLYTPVMSFALLGFIFLYKYLRTVFFPVLLIFFLSGYIIFSWWCWWYGGSYGLRALIDFYGLLTLPMASLLQRYFTNLRIKIFILQLFLFLISLNLFQTWQCKRGLIHHDSMTREAYWTNFGKTEMGFGWWEKLKAPDYNKALRGEDEE